MEEARKFEWDEAKRLTNLEKHGIDFYGLAGAFEDDNALHIPDDRNDYGEQRVIMLADNTGLVLVIVYTMRNDKTRIISARRASMKERNVYYGER